MVLHSRVLEIEQVRERMDRDDTEREEDEPSAFGGLSELSVEELRRLDGLCGAEATWTHSPIFWNRGNLGESNK